MVLLLFWFIFVLKHTSFEELSFSKILILLFSNKLLISLFSLLLSIIYFSSVLELEFGVFTLFIIFSFSNIGVESFFNLSLLFK